MGHVTGHYHVMAQCHVTCDGWIACIHPTLSSLLASQEEGTVLSNVIELIVNLSTIMLCFG